MVVSPIPPMPENLSPCPFCGAVLKRDDNRHTGAQHPPNTPCPISGWFIGARILSEDWNNRWGAPALTMTVEDDRPVFHDNSSGRAVTARELNLYIDWYETQKRAP